MDRWMDGQGLDGWMGERREGKNYLSFFLPVCTKPSICPGEEKAVKPLGRGPRPGLVAASVLPAA